MALNTNISPNINNNSFNYWSIDPNPKPDTTGNPLDEKNIKAFTRRSLNKR